MSLFATLFNRRERAAARDLERRLRQFRAEIAAVRAGRPAGDQAIDPAALARLRSMPAELGLTGDDAELELELVDGLIAADALQRSLAEGGELPVVPTSHRAVAGERCHLVSAASRPDVPGDEGGRLFLTERRLVHLGSPTISIGWPHVLDAHDEGRDLVIRRRSGQVHVFRCNSYGDALLASCMVSRLARPHGPA
jgi:hypothetical protein